MASAQQRLNFATSAEQRLLADAVAKLCARFDDAYWLQKDQAGAYPEEFYGAIAQAGWLGVAMPVEYGGAGLGITEAAIVLHAVAESGAGMSGASAIHMNIFGLQPVVVFGTHEQKQRMLPPLIAGREKACFAVTEPDAGLNTTQLKTTAERRGDHYVVSGQKIWISTAQGAHKMLILCRTTPLQQVTHKTEGLSLFYTTLDRRRVEVREIAKLGRHAVDSDMLFIDRLEVPADDLIGNEGDGFRQIVHALNPERILVAAEAIGLGRAALGKAVRYAKERIVFGRPIGQNQGIQHPLAQCWMTLEAAHLLVLRAASYYDQGIECAAEANAAKYMAAEAGFAACQTAVMTLGGMGYAAEYHVERYLRESLIPRIAPVSPHMIMNFIAEKVLGLPRSY
jgi:acyl-CoA dehydrogenase